MKRPGIRVAGFTLVELLAVIAIEADGTFTYSRTSFVKFADFSRTSPSAIWVFIDEHELTITNGRFDLQWPMGLRWKWAGNWPARRHGGRGVLSFADGHGELRRWKDARTGPPVRTWAEAWAIGFEAQDNADYAWLWERTNGPWPFPAN